MVATGINRQLSWAVIHDAAIATLKLTALVMWILFAAHAFSTAYTALGAQSLIQNIMSMIPGGRWGALFFMLVVLFFFGMVLDPVGIMLITLPVFLPVVLAFAKSTCPQNRSPCCSQVSPIRLRSGFGHPQ
jgi:TRAP-type mannitol/chloroaromatic compound transport system permease large subunit